MAEAQKRIFTGFQASGQLHIGNYFGAVKPNVDLFAAQKGLFMVADYHALTSLKDPASLRTNIIENVKDYLAAGLNLDNAILFKQSDVSEHTELAWIFNCLVTVPFLMQGHAYKDKVAKGLEPNAGLFTYPMLMAADILLYDTDIVPVGEDQRQHVEYAREAAAKFNLAFGQTFKEPTEVISKAVGVVPGTDGKKMSKSYGNTIPLFGSKEEIAKAVMSIVTDSSGERPENVYAIHKLLLDQSGLDKVYSNPAVKGKYKLIKEALIEDLEAFIAPMRDRRANISDEDVKKVLKDGGEKAKEIASAKMEDVRKKVGVTL
jgi:tryptophanyl-tRNA synthetase